ncbi:MAG: Uma2 family endonuclease [Pyrinomonadaceae bacterium]
MTTVLESPKIREILTDGVLLHDISWSTYERLLDEHPDAPSPRFTYDCGDLLIMVTSPEHENINRTLNLLVELLAAEFEIESLAFGSTTYKRKDLQRGFEPDSCFYFQNEVRMRGKKRLDLSVDPPPDLVIEIDITSPSIRKLPLFAAFGIPEVWRFDGEKVEIHILGGSEYALADHSFALPKVSGNVVTDLLRDSAKMGRLEWIKSVRSWAREEKASSQK